MISNISLNKYLNDLASLKPAPGGGSAAGLSACLGVSLLCMVANFSMGKRFIKTKSKAKNILNSLEKIKNNLNLLVYLDIEVYNLVVLARDLDNATKIKAYSQSRDVAYAICYNCYEALKLAGDLVDISNFNLVSDLEAAVYLLEGAFKSANIFVEINNNAIKAIRG